MVRPHAGTYYRSVQPILLIYVRLLRLMGRVLDAQMSLLGEPKPMYVMQAR